MLQEVATKLHYAATGNSVTEPNLSNYYYFFLIFALKTETEGRSIEGIFSSQNKVDRSLRLIRVSCRYE